MGDEPQAQPIDRSLRALAIAFGRVSTTAFGGGQNAAIRREVVRRYRWLDDEAYLEVLSLAQLIPGSNPTNTSVLVGQRVHGLSGAIVAMLATTLPAFGILMLLGAFALNTHQPWMTGALRGCAAMAVGLTFATAIEMTATRVNLIDLAIIAAVALSVLVLHFSLALTLAIFIPVALVLTHLKKRAA